MRAVQTANGKSDRECYRCSSPLSKRYGWVASALLSVTIIATHVLFVFGQFKPLYSFVVTAKTSEADIQVNFQGIFNASNIDKPVDDLDVVDVIKAYSYNDTLHHLWTDNEVTDKLLATYGLTGDPNFAYNRTAPRILFWVLLAMSGIWPHVKLIIVHLLWYLPANDKLRSKWLWALDFFGKYSMADVFTCLVMVSYTRLVVETTVYHAFENIKEGMPAFLSRVNSSALGETVCRSVVNETLNTSSSAIAECEKAADIFLDFNNHWMVRTLLDRMDFSASAGNVEFSFSALADNGIYWFSTAVWFTLLISAVVNILADRVIKENKQNNPDHNFGYSPLEEVSVAEPVPSRLIYQAGLATFERYVVLCTVAGTGLFVYLGMTTPLVDRFVHGTAVEFIDLAIGEDESSAFHQSFTMIQTMTAVAEGGGQNKFLQKDLVAFTIVCPILLVLFAAMLILLPLRPKHQNVMVEAVKLMYSFSGWEIYVLVTLLMIGDLFALTLTLPLSLPGFVMGVCKPLETIIMDAPLGGVCFVEVLKLDPVGFGFLLAGTAGMFITRVVCTQLHEAAMSGSSKHGVAFAASHFG